MVEFVLTGHIPQPEASILYELAEQFGATFVQLKISPSELTVVRFTSLGAGNGSAWYFGRERISVKEDILKCLHNNSEPHS